MNHDPEPLLRQAVERAPHEAAARLALAEHLHATRRAALALEQLDELDAKARASSRALSLRAKVLTDLGRIEEEVEILEQLLADYPDEQAYLIRLGHAYRALGRTDEAIETYRRVLAEQPHDGMAWSSLANVKTTRFSDQDVAAMNRALSISEPASMERVRLNFALGKAHADRGEHEQAYRHYAEGNRLRSAMGNYNPETISKTVDRWITLFTRDFLAARASDGFPAADPIFIIGIQRSGSTLVEQILASHPQVEGTAELTDLANVVRELGQAAERRKLGFTDFLQQVDASDLRAAGEAYIERTRLHRELGRPFFTDKMPNNWIYVGLILLILPNAKIVDVRRHPLDCCLSNWTQFYGRGLEHSYAMDTMAKLYADYVRLMRHFDEVHPGAVHRVIYERLVGDLEGEVRRLLDYLKLPFDEACLAFHSTERTVHTASSEQVRRPLNRSGIGRWKPFEQWLGTMKEALGDTLEDWQR